MSNLKEIQKSLGINFSHRSILKEALLHRSYLNENPDSSSRDNQRLEFLGDALLDFISGDHLYKHYPDIREGELTRLRAALVKEETLAQFARSINLGRYLYLGRGEEESGGRERPSLLSDAFEALVGAIYLDKGIKGLRRFLAPFLKAELERLTAEGGTKDFKSLLQERVQAKSQTTPHYRTVAARGPDHAKEFTVEVIIKDKVYGTGRGNNKQAAQQEAARQALLELGYDNK